MAKLPRDVSHDRLVRFLLKRGWRIDRQGGRHTIVAKGGNHVAIPRHASLTTGVLAAILKQTGTTDDASEL